MKIKNIILLCLLTCFSLQAKKIAPIDPNNLFPQIILETSMGNITVELDRVKAPITVNNFLFYVVSGEYNNTVFHRVIEDFVVQGGGYDTDYYPKKVGENIPNESGNGLKNEAFSIAMAKENQPHTANRQFFFNLVDNKSLNPGNSWGYAVFGSVIKGEEVLSKIAQVKTDYNEAVNWDDVPVEPVILRKATLLPAQ